MTAGDFERAKATEDHVVLTESALDDREVAIAFPFTRSIDDSAIPLPLRVKEVSAAVVGAEIMGGLHDVVLAHVNHGSDLDELRPRDLGATECLEGEPQKTVAELVPLSR